MNLHTNIPLNDGSFIPQFGLGVYQSAPGEEAEQAVLWALQAGYRHIDTAAIYQNEADVGRAIKKSGIPRKDIYVTTKLWDADQGYESAIAACEKSLKKLGLDYIDLYLIHSPNKQHKRLDSWRALQELKKRGIVKNIGVSNYGVHHLKELMATNPEFVPAVNQLEVHPWLTRTELVEFCKANNIVVEAYSPLAKAHKMGDPRLQALAKKYNKTPGQILIRWSLQCGYVCIPKSTKQSRIVENASVFDFELSAEDVREMATWDEYFITGWDPTKAP
ncbi:uncharacterized protein VTP21DRAFT_97 [Calcarisporiella thermophila]|uniref:uncharacterized protein n=1 Tax=Calcarisporiella thermophila TaxID=911321 RepID=UPI0037430F60